MNMKNNCFNDYMKIFASQFNKITSTVLMKCGLDYGLFSYLRFKHTFCSQKQLLGGKPSVLCYETERLVSERCIMNTYQNYCFKITTVYIKVYKV